LSRSLYLSVTSALTAPAYTYESLLPQCHIGLRIERSFGMKSFLTKNSST
jgi:hypothetical protein